MTSIWDVPGAVFRCINQRNARVRKTSEKIGSVCEVGTSLQHEVERWNTKSFSDVLNSLEGQVNTYLGVHGKGLGRKINLLRDLEEIFRRTG
jgi:hypothetical protein